MTPRYRFLTLTSCCVLALGLLLPSEAAAQRRSSRPVVRASVFVGRPVYYPRYYTRYYSPFYDPFSWGWRGYGYWQYPPYPYYGRYYDRTGAVRLQVTPKQTQVYVDGYYVGTVDDFDGALQRLRIDAGEHELEFYLEGYRTARQKVLFRRDGTLKVSHTMEALAAGETSERPVPVDPPPTADQARPDAGAPPDRGRPGERMPPPQNPGQRDDFGTLALQVQPGDAEILIDGQRWDGSDGGSRLRVQLAEGPHRVEIKRDGYRTYTANIRIRRGQTETLNVSLAQ